MRIINLIDRFDTINFGVWNAAISTAEILKEKYNVDSEMWYLKNDYHKPLNIKQKQIDIDTLNIAQYVKEENLNTNETIFVTHGCWQYPTRWGAKVGKFGFKWVYVPHAMLMPWCMNQKHLLKKVYYTLFEKRWARSADIVRAVGYTEFDQLNVEFNNVVHIPNGIELKQFKAKNWNGKPIEFLYLARIHKVKWCRFYCKWMDKKWLGK